MLTNTSARQGDVDGLLDEHPLVALGLELGLPLRQRLPDRGAGGADPLAGLGPRGGRQGPDLGVGQGDRRPVTGVRQPGRLQVIQGAGGGDRGERLVGHALDLAG
jgi:hypothetical protein